MDLGSKVKISTAITPQTISASAAFSAIDRTWFEGGVFAGLVGPIVGAPDATTLTFKLTECDTSGGVYSDISGASMLVTASASLGATVIKISQPLNWNKKYIKPYCTVAFSGGSSPYVGVSGLFVMGGSKELPSST